MTYTRRVLLSALFILFALAPFVRSALGAEGDIPSISIPPEAEYLARSIYEKFDAYCGDTAKCKLDLGFEGPDGQGRVLNFARPSRDATLVIIEEAGPFFPRREGGYVITREIRKTITLSNKGKIVRAREATSGDDFATTTNEGDLLWSATTDLLTAVDQFLDSVKEHRDRMSKPKGQDI